MATVDEEEVELVGVDAASTRSVLADQISDRSGDAVVGLNARGIGSPQSQADLDLRMYRVLKGEDSDGKRERLQAYRGYRHSRGEDPFVYLEQGQRQKESRNFAQQLPMLRTMFSGAQNFTSAFPDTERAGVDAMFANSMDPDADKRATANKMLFGLMTGQEVDDQIWPVIRTRYATEHLGWSGASGSLTGDGAEGVAPTIISEDAFYSLAKVKLDEQQNERDNTEKIYQASVKAAFSGQPLTTGYAKAKEVAGKGWQSYQAAAEQGFASVLRDFTDADLSNMRPIYEDWAGTAGLKVEDIAGPAGQSYAEYAKLDEKGKKRWLDGIGMMAYSDGKDIENYYARISGAFRDAAFSNEGLNESGNLRVQAEGYKHLLQSGLMPASIPANRPATEISRANQSASDIMTEMFGASYLYNPANKGTPVVETRPMTGQERQEFENARDQILGYSEFIADSKNAGIQANRYRDNKITGFWDALADTGVLLAESLPTMATASLPSGIGVVRLGRAYEERNRASFRAIGADEQKTASYAIAGGLMEAGIDRLQVFSLGANVPKVSSWLLQWGKPGAVANFAFRSSLVAAAEGTQEVAQELTAPAFHTLADALEDDMPGHDWRATMSRLSDSLGDIALMSLGFGIIFGGGGSIASNMDAGRMKQLLSDRDGLDLSGLPPEKSRQISQLAQTNPAAAAELARATWMETPVETLRANSEAAQEVQSRVATAREAGLPVLEKLDDGRVQINYPDRAAEIVAGNDEALNAVRLWENDTSIAIQKGNRELVQYLSTFDRGETGLAFEATEVDSAGRLGDMARQSAEASEQAINRVHIAARQAGIEMGLTEEEIAEIPIIGTSENVTKDGVTTIVTQIVKDGATPLDVIQEHAEGVAKWMMASQSVGREKMIGWVRQTEQKTGQAILPESFNVASTSSDQEIIEAWSYLTQANAVGRVEDSALPASAKSFFRAFKEFISNALRIAADFLRVRGDLDEEFRYWLDVSSGIDPETQLGRVQDEASQAVAQAAGITLSISLPGQSLAEQINERIKDPEPRAQAFSRMKSLVTDIAKRQGPVIRNYGLSESEAEAARLSLEAQQEQEMERHRDSLARISEDRKTAQEIGNTEGAKESTAERKAEMSRHRAVMDELRRERESIRSSREEGQQTERRQQTATEQFQQIQDIATLEAIIRALPPEIRGRVGASFRKLADLRTTESRADYIQSLLPRIDKVLESYLQTQYRKAIAKILDKGAVKVSDSRTRGGKISPEGHDIFKLAEDSMKIVDDPDGLTAAEQAELEIQKLTDQIEAPGSLTMEALDLLDAKRAAIELFYDYDNADSARLALALEFLTETYQEGRKAWLNVLQERKAVTEYRVATTTAGLGVTGMVRPQELAAAKRADEGFLRSLDEGILSLIASGSQKIRRLGENTSDPAVRSVLEDAEGAFASSEALESDLNAGDQQALKLAIRSILGVSTEYSVAKRLRELSDGSKESPVTTLVGRSEETVSVPKDVVASLIAKEASGFTKKNGEEVALSSDDVALLSQAWDEFLSLDPKGQAKKRNITFTRTISGGKRESLGTISQLEGLYLWLTMRQPDQFEKLEKLGYDQQTLDELVRWLPDDVKNLGVWMADYIGKDTFTIDQIHRNEYGVGLALVDNYFPVVTRAAQDVSGLSLDGNPPQQSGRSASFRKQRVKNTTQPELVNAIAVFLSHRAQSNFWRSHVAAIREWKPVFKSSRLKDAVEVKMGAKYYASLVRLMDRIESGGVLNARVADDFDKIVKGITRRFAQATLGGRVSTLLVNTTAALNATFEIPTPALIRGAMEVAKRPESFKDAWNSPAIQRRMRDGSTFEAQLARKKGPITNPLLAVADSLAKPGLQAINYVDTAANMLGAVAVWEYTKNEGIRAGLTEEEARRAADTKVDRVLLRAAQPTSRLARSEFEQKAAESPLGALFTMFVSEPRKNLAITYLAAREILTGKGTYGKAMAGQQLAVGLILMAAAENILRGFYQAWANAKDDEEDEVWDRFTQRMTDPKAWGYKLTTQYLQNVPLVGEGWNQAMAGLFDQKAFPASQNPIVPALNAVNKVRKEIADDDEATTEEMIDGAIEVAQRVGAVVPGGQVVGQLGNVADFVEGVAESESEKLDRYKGRYGKFSKELDEQYGKTTGPDGKICKDVKAKKDAAKADWIRSNILPLPPAEKKAALEKIDPSEDVEKAMRMK